MQLEVVVLNKRTPFKKVERFYSDLRDIAASLKLFTKPEQIEIQYLVSEFNYSLVALILRGLLERQDRQDNEKFMEGLRNKDYEEEKFTR